MKRRMPSLAVDTRRRVTCPWCDRPVPWRGALLREHLDPVAWVRCPASNQTLASASLSRPGKPPLVTCQYGPTPHRLTDACERVTFAPDPPRDRIEIKTGGRWQDVSGYLAAPITTTEAGGTGHPTTEER